MMKKQFYNNTISRLLGVTLVILAVWSCTKDYFEDETNFKIYIPQVKEGTIDNVLVAIHDGTGTHRYTRYIEGPFDPNTVGRDGILRFKLPWGEDYKVSCFANVERACCAEGEAYGRSYISEPVYDGDAALHRPGPDFRVVLQDDITVYPLNHPMASKLDTVNLDDTRVYKGHVTCEFRELPSQVARIDIRYKGIGTHMCYDGCYGRPSAGQVVSSVAVQGGAAVTTLTDHLFPSTGMHYLDEDVNPCEPLDLEVLFYGADGGLMGQFYSLHTDAPTVTDPEGNSTTWDYMLRPKHQLKFVFKGFTVFEIKLSGWGDITEGEVTPM